MVLVVVDGNGRVEGFLTCSQVAFEAFAHAVHKSPAYVDSQQHHLQQNRGKVRHTSFNIKYVLGRPIAFIATLSIVDSFTVSK